MRHTHHPHRPADQHVRHPCSQPEGGSEPSESGNLGMIVGKTRWVVSSNVQLSGRRLPDGNTLPCGPITASPELPLT